MRQINPKKLLHSKWTAQQPVNREKHFIVTKLYRDEENEIIACEIEAVISKRSQRLDWRELRCELEWQQGWQH